MQLLGLKVPDPLLLKLTVPVPVGVTGVPGDVSVTVAVQEVGAFTGSGLGEQLMLVEAERLLAVRLKLLELITWSVSPP